MGAGPVNDKAQQPAYAGLASCLDEPSVAWSVSCSTWFAVLPSHLSKRTAVGMPSHAKYTRGRSDNGLQHRMNLGLDLRRDWVVSKRTIHQAEEPLARWGRRRAEDGQSHREGDVATTDQEHSIRHFAPELEVNCEATLFQSSCGPMHHLVRCS
jgi:hypothetical protein